MVNLKLFPSKKVKIKQKTELIKRVGRRGFPGSPAVKTQASNAGGTGLTPDWGTNIPLAKRCSQKKKKKTFFLNSGEEAGGKRKYKYPNSL